MNDIVRAKLETLPKKPGSYQYKDIDGNIIYVGKAKNLYNRVHSYFVGSHDAKTTKLVSQIYDLEYTITSTEIEALILEINLIKRYRPKYNIMMMDDKQYPYIVVSKEANPKVYYTRDIDNVKGKVYGPYPNSKAAKEVVEMLNRIYPLRKCSKLPKKECLYYHIGQCLAPCIKTIDKSQYDSITSKIHNILKGNVKDEIKILTTFMEQASIELNFEKAIEYRNLIESLNAIGERQKMEGYLLDTDVFGYFKHENDLSIQIFHLREGKMIERNGYLLDLMDGEDEETKYQEFIVSFYLVNNNPLPKNILICSGNEKELSDTLGCNVSKPIKGTKKELVNLVIDNAKNKIDTLLNSKEREYQKTIGAMNEISKILDIDSLHTMEMFDNSNIMGASPVSAMISIKDGKFDKKNYRKYKIRTVDGPNDVGTMYEVVTRRYQHTENNPDLIIMDGGENQVNACINALKDVGRSIKVLGLVKDDNHKTRALFYNGKEIEIDKRSFAFKLLELAQEEVHRYAITYFRSTHLKDTFSSNIEKIKGIGKAKSRKILQALKEEDPYDAIKHIGLNNEQFEEVVKICSLSRKEE